MAPPKKSFTLTNSASGSSSPFVSLAEDYSYTEAYKPFKNPNYIQKNSGGVGRRTKSIKQILTVERERGEKGNRELREKRDREIEEEERMRMEVDGNVVEGKKRAFEEVVTYASSEAPPSIIPQKKYCDVTGLLAPYVDPKSTLRYHNVEVYDVIKSFQPAVIQTYLAVRGNAAVLR